MNKNTHFIGQPLYVQLLNYFNRDKILSLSQVQGDEHYIKKYCCPVKINWKLCISFPIGVAAVLLIQGLGFQFQTVSIIKCAYIDKESPIITR